MHFNSDQDGIGLDLTPFVTAANTTAETYAKVKAADASAAAMKAAAKKPVINTTTVTAGGVRKPNYLAYGILAVLGVGGFFVVRRMLGKRRR